MRASAPGIAFRARTVESSPVGGGTTSTWRAASRARVFAAIAVACLGIGAWQFGSAAYIHAKAFVAQALLHRAWTKVQATGRPAAPWPWADTHPVARLIAPSHDVDLLVLEGANARTLAFGPGHLEGSAIPGDNGHAVLSAHRDTHFRFLRRLALGDPLVVVQPSGRRAAYRVTDLRIVDQRDLALPKETPRPQLTLVTCYPFDAVTSGGSLRYVATATVQ